MKRRYHVLLAGWTLTLGSYANGDCSVANATLAFGSYNPVAASPSVFSSTITVTCFATISATTTVPYTLLLSAGSGTVSNRKMVGSSSNLPYNIYTTASYSTVWDNVVGVGGNVTLVGLLGLPVLTYGTSTQVAYGRILALQPVPAGMFTDSLTITVSF